MEDIKTYTERYKVSFPIMHKCDVNPTFDEYDMSKPNPSFTWLRHNSSLKGFLILWNFAKFLLNEQGHVV